VQGVSHWRGFVWSGSSTDETERGLRTPFLSDLFPDYFDVYFTDLFTDYCHWCIFYNCYHGAGKRDREFYSFHTHSISTS
jgi:hypothetical protein